MASAILAVVVLGAIAMGTRWISTHTGVYDNVTIVHGIVVLADAEATFFRPNPDECRGEGAYAGFGGGMEVVITDHQGYVVGEARTRPQAGVSDSSLDPDGVHNCTAGFQLKDMSYDSETYTISVGEPGSAIYASVTYTGDYLENHREIGLFVGPDD